jgi:N-acetyl-gamma-glutamyl-phosphate reductase
MSSRIRAVVLGAGGYVGGELLRLIAAHPQFELAAAVSDSRAGTSIGDTFGHLSQALSEHSFVSQDGWLDRIAEKAINIHVVDSSADFRYARQSDYENVYQTEHGAPQLLDQFVCAVPEHLGAADVPHVGHPGCFATATLLATVPLIASGLTEADIFVSAITGSTGSGRSPQAGTHHPERNSNLYAYKPLAHRHAPEIAGLTAAASGRETSVHFVPHSGPFARGIHVTLQAKAKSTVSEAELRELFESAYEASPFIEVVAATPRLKDVVASNRCHIGIATDGESVVVMSAIDNLVKGAAGGAMQWMNRLWNFPETTGLMAPAPGWT